MHILLKIFDILSLQSVSHERQNLYNCTKIIYTCRNYIKIVIKLLLKSLLKYNN